MGTPDLLPRSATSQDERNALLARLGLPLLLLTALAVSLRPGLQSDTYWHLASGRWMLEERAWLKVDVFSWTVEGRAWPRPGLIADIVMVRPFEMFGAPLLVTVVSVLFVGAFLLLFTSFEASPAVMIGVGVLCILASIVVASARPQVALLPLTAYALVVLDREHRSGGSRLLWTLPLVAVVWVNTHGTFVVLFVLLGCHGLAMLIDRTRGGYAEWQHRFSRLLAVGLLVTVATLVNPFGAQMLTYPFEYMQVEAHHGILDEWRRPVPTDLRSWPVYALIATAVFALLRPRQPRRTVDIVLLLVFGGLALTAVRHSAVFAIVAYPILARLLSGGPAVSWTEVWVAARPSERRIETGVLAVVLLLALVVSAPALTPGGNDRATGELMPTTAAQAVVEGALPGRLWNSYDVGGYVIWEGWPEVLVSMDSRADLYGDELVREHIAEWRGERNAPAAFDSRGIQVVLVERQAPLVQQLEEAGWRLVETDELGVVLISP